MRQIPRTGECPFWMYRQNKKPPLHGAATARNLLKKYAGRTWNPKTDFWSMITHEETKFYQVVFVNIKQTTGSHGEKFWTCCKNSSPKPDFQTISFASMRLTCHFIQTYLSILFSRLENFTGAVCQKQENPMISEFGGQRPPFWNGIVIRHNMIIDVIYLIK